MCVNYVNKKGAKKKKKETHWRGKNLCITLTTNLSIPPKKGNMHRERENQNKKIKYRVQLEKQYKNGL